MTAKEKAIELVYYYKELLEGCAVSFISSLPKLCATRSVDEILKQFNGLNKPEYVAFDCIGERQFTYDGEYEDRMTGYDMVNYWIEVKSEIEAL